MNQNQDLLFICLKEIENRLKWIPSNEWQHKHFESLNELILTKTQVSLSPLTLKRLWGKIKYDSNPSATTLDTLARFLDYKDWIDYQCKQNEKNNKLKFFYLKNKKVLTTTGLIIVLLTATISIVRMMPASNTKDYSNFEFSVQKLSSGIPNTVYFKYNAKNTNADSVLIQQSWDPKLRHLVDKNKTDFSCIYYYPGYYKAKLLLDKKIVSQQDLYIKSNGWLGIVHKDPVPFYLNAEEIIDDNKILIKEGDLIDAGFDLNKEIPHTTLNLVEEFDSISGNDFELHTVFKQTYPNGDAICQKSELIILCSESFFYIPFSIKGCVNELGMYIPQKEISAKNTDLSILGIEGAADVKIKVSKGIFKLIVNHNSTMIDTLTANPGKIVGLKFGFHGTGEVSSFKLSSGNTSYSEHDFFP